MILLTDNVKKGDMGATYKVTAKYAFTDLRREAAVGAPLIYRDRQGPRSRQTQGGAPPASKPRPAKDVSFFGTTRRQVRSECRTLLRTRQQLPVRASISRAPREIDLAKLLGSEKNEKRLVDQLCGLFHRGWASRSNRAAAIPTGTNNSRKDGPLKETGVPFRESLFLIRKFSARRSEVSAARSGASAADYTERHRQLGRSTAPFVVQETRKRGAGKEKSKGPWMPNVMTEKRSR